MRNIKIILARVKHALSSNLSRRILLSIAIFLVVIVAFQLVWPSSRTRPFLVVSNLPMGGANEAQVATKLDTIKQDAKLELQLGDKAYAETLNNTGISIDAKQTAKAVVSYPVWQKLIPFSLFGSTVHRPKVATVYDQQNIEQHAKDWSALAYIPPTNATVAIAGTEVALVPDKDGTQYKPEDITKELKKLVIKQGTQRKEVSSKPVDATRKSGDVKGVIKQAETAIKEPLKLTVLDKSVEVPADVKASWLTFAESADKKALSLDIKKEALQAYLAPYQKSVYIAPGTTTVTVVDGKETGRTTGEKGRGLDIDRSIAAIKTQLEKPSDKPLVLNPSELQPNVVYNRSYSKTSAGLAAFLADLGKSKGDYAITVRELGGAGRSASYNGGKMYHPASTYKLFVAYGVLKRIEAGSLQWETPFLNGQTVDQCFEAMIVRSDNACAEKFGGDLGWGNIQNDIRGIGIGSTVLVSGGGFRSNTDDQVNFLQKLLSGNIVTDPNKDKLLSAMSRQIYRAGIPAGTRVAVADKVGFLNGLFHDTAIVYSPNGTYLISIYSNGSTWGGVADTAKQIEAFLK